MRLRSVKSLTGCIQMSLRWGLDFSTNTALHRYRPSGAENTKIRAIHTIRVIRDSDNEHPHSPITILIPIFRVTFYKPPIKTTANPVIIYIHNFFQIYPFSEFTLNTLKLTTSAKIPQSYPSCNPVPLIRGGNAIRKPSYPGKSIRTSYR